MVVLRFFISILLILFTCASEGVLAGESAFIEVTIDEARLIRLDADAAQIIVGNPAIADAAVQSAKLLVITGKSFGATNLIALDSAGHEILAVRLGVREGAAHKVTVYRGIQRQSLDCAPECQRTLSIGDDKSQFEQLAESLTKKFSVVNSAIGGN